MKHIRLLGIALASALSGLSASAEAVDELPVKIINGKSYHFYEVKAKETIYSLCHRLDVTKSQIIEFNPAVADGLKAGMVLYFPVNDNDAEKADDITFDDGSKRLVHHVKKGETIYGIAKHYGITTEDLFRHNPFIADGLKADQTLTIVVDSPTPASTTVVSYEGYVVKEKETFYSIAHAHSLSVAQLEAANPGVTVLKAGQVLNIPVFTAATPSAPDAAATIPVVETVSPDTIPVAATPAQPETAAADEILGDTVETPRRQRERIDITVILPFMLNQDPISKEGRRFTEFYKGFLIAVDAMRDNGTPITVRAYDTASSLDSVKAILAKPELKTTDVIIAPDNFSQMVAIGEFGRQNGINIFNPFIVKDETYLANPVMMQANLPSEIMQTKAAAAIPKILPGYTPVIVSQAGHAGDKADIVADMKAHFAAQGISFREMNYTEKLAPSQLESLDKSQKYVFVSTSGRQSDVNKILPALVEWKETLPDPANVTVFGYPEWITFRGETLTNMQALNTRVYSRFYTDPMDIETRAVEDTFKKWFGGEMENAMPRQGLMGYDTGMFLIKGLAGNDSLKSADPYRGVQNGFKFVSADNGGMFNDVLYIVTFRPSGYTDRAVL